MNEPFFISRFLTFDGLFALIYRGFPKSYSLSFMFSLFFLIEVLYVEELPRTPNCFIMALFGVWILLGDREIEWSASASDKFLRCLVEEGNATDWRRLFNLLFVFRGVMGGLCCPDLSANAGLYAFLTYIVFAWVLEPTLAADLGLNEGEGIACLLPVVWFLTVVIPVFLLSIL